jgi:Kef-type K+ transport system membrane component KefB
MSLPTGPEWNFLVLLTVIAVGPFVAERLRLPGIIGLLIGGFLISHQGLGLLTSEELVAVVGELGLLYLMFLAGAELDLGLFARLRRSAIAFGLLTFALPFILGTALALWLSFEPVAAVLIGSLWASHTLVTYPIVRRFGLMADPSVAVSVGATVVTDTLALVVLAVVSKAVTTGGVGLSTILGLGIGLGILAIAAFTIVPRLALWFFAGLGQERTLRFVFVLAACYGLAALSEQVGIEGIVGAFFAGLGMNRVLPHGSPLAERVEFFGSALFVPAFLVSVGLVIDPAVLFQASTLQLALVFLVAVTVGKLGAAVIGSRRFGFGGAQAGVMFGLTYSQAAATLAAATVGVAIGLFGAHVLNAVIVVIMVSLFVASVVTTRFAARVPPSTEIAANLGDVVVVPLDDPEVARRVLPNIARIAAADGGLVVPVHIVTPGDRARMAAARTTAAAIDASASAAGIEAEPSLRVAASIGQGIRNAVASAGGTLLVLARPRGLAPQDIVFGGVEAEHIAASAVPTVIWLPADERAERVLLPLRRRDLAPEGLVDALIAVQLASRLEAQRVELLVGIQEGATLPPEAILPVDAERVTFRHGRVEWVRDAARPGDLVLLPAALETIVVGLDASRVGALPGVAAAVVAGPYRSATYVGNREAIAAIETAAT